MEDPFWIGAQICATLVNVNRTKGRTAKTEDFIPYVATAARQSPEEMYAAFRAVAAHLGGK